MRLVFIAAAAALTASSASAAQIYSDAASWNAQMSSVTAVPLPVTASAGSFTAGDLTFTKSGSASNLHVGTPDEWSTVIPGNDLAISSPEDVTVTFGTAVTGFSFLLHEPTASSGIQDACNAACVETTFNFKLFAGALEIGSFDLDPANDVANFVGFSSAVAFDKVVIDDVTNAIDNEFFGEFQTGTYTPVPLPASLPFLAAALAAFGLIRRRRG